MEYSPASGFFCSKCFWDLFMLLWVLVVHSFLLLWSIPFSDYATICLTILLLMDILVSSFQLLWIKLLWTFLKSLCVETFSFILGKLLGVELLGHRVGICIIYKEPKNDFLRWLLHFSLLPVTWEFQLFHILANIYIVSF